MRPPTYNLIIDRNTNFKEQFNIEIDNTPINISTYTFYSKIRDEDNNFILDFTITKLDNYVFQLSLSKAQTQSLELTTYYYDLIKSVSGDEDVLISKSPITVLNTVTNLE